MKYLYTIYEKVCKLNTLISPCADRQAQIVDSNRQGVSVIYLAVHSKDSMNFCVGANGEGFIIFYVFKEHLQNIDYIVFYMFDMFIRIKSISTYDIFLDIRCLY